MPVPSGPVPSGSVPPPTPDDELHAALLSLVEEFARNEVAPRAAEAERSATFPRGLFRGLGRMDLAGLPFGADVGGAEVPGRVSLQVVERLSAAFLTLGLGLSVHNLATWVVDRFATGAVRAEVAPRLTSGEWLGAYSLSEPGSGSDAAALSTSARRERDGYVVNGTKAWVTHAGEADVYIVMCRTSPHRTRGISALLVPADTPGIAFPPRERKMGLASSPTGQLVFSDARVPARNLLGDEGEGLRIALQALDGGRLGIAAAAVGLAQEALDHALAHARTREQFGRPIGSFQGLGFLLADMATRVAASRALYLDAAGRRDRGEDFSMFAAMAKLQATDAAMSVTTDAVQVLGGYGYTTEYPVERLMREAKVTQIVEGTNQVQRMVIARALLGRLAAPVPPSR